MAGSALAGAAHNMELPLLVGRVIQGLGMGGLTALVVAIIGSIIPPRERGRYSGYMGAVMAVAMAGGPVLGGVIADSPLGWRWCFYVCIPLAVIALGLLQRLHLETQRKDNVTIDWLGATLMTAGVSVLLIWVSFAGKDDYYAWISPESAYYVIGGVALLALTVFVEIAGQDPVIRSRSSPSAPPRWRSSPRSWWGWACSAPSPSWGSTSRPRGTTAPPRAGLLTIPMVIGMLTGTMVSGQMITRFGKWKPFIIGGSILLTIGLGLLGTIDHATPIVLIGIYMFIMGLGTGSLMQNLVLAVQNTVSVRNIGAASSNVAFFRTFGGAIGVSIKLQFGLGHPCRRPVRERLGQAGHRHPASSPAVATSTSSRCPRPSRTSSGTPTVTPRPPSS